MDRPLLLRSQWLSERPLWSADCSCTPFRLGRGRWREHLCPSSHQGPSDADPIPGRRRSTHHGDRGAHQHDRQIRHCQHLCHQRVAGSGVERPGGLLSVREPARRVSAEHSARTGRQPLSCDADHHLRQLRPAAASRNSLGTRADMHGVEWTTYEATLARWEIFDEVAYRGSDGIDASSEPCCRVARGPGQAACPCSLCGRTGHRAIDSDGSRCRRAQFKRGGVSSRQCVPQYRLRQPRRNSRDCRITGGGVQSARALHRDPHNSGDRDHKPLTAGLSHQRDRRAQFQHSQACMPAKDPHEKDRSSQEIDGYMRKPTQLVVDRAFPCLRPSC